MAKVSLFVLGILCSAAYLFAEEGAIWEFKDVTAEVIDVNPPGIGPVFDYAFADINDDGALDIVLNNHHRSKPSPVWLGTPGRKFTFWQNMPEAWLPLAGFHLGEVDINGDGKTDLICTGNEGGVVVNINTSAPGALKPSFEPIPIHRSSHLVSFADFDRDGKLETLLRPGLIFGDLKEEPVMSGMQFGNWAVGDFDSDGWPDLFAAGEKGRREAWSGPRKLWRNEGGALEEVPAEEAWLTSHFGGIPKVGDFNNDGHFDLYLFGGSSGKGGDQDRGDLSMRLYLGDGKFGFRDVSEEAGIAVSKQKAGYSHVYLADVDNDTHLDIINQGNYGTFAWRNNGDGSFSVLPKSVTGEWASSSHLRFDDYDMDGRLDIVTSGVGPGWKDRPASVRVFRNVTENGNGWIKVQLRQEGGNTMGIGGIVTVCESGTETILGKRVVASDTEGNHPRLHFGLGRIGSVDIEVRFPGGGEARWFRGERANRYLRLRPDGSVSELR